MIAQKLEIYKTTLDIVNYLYKNLKNVQRLVRYSIYQKICDITADALDLIYLANKYKDKRIAYLEKYIDNMNKVHSRLRILGENKYLSQKQVTFLMLRLDSCLKQATGWRNSSYT